MALWPCEGTGPGDLPAHPRGLTLWEATPSGVGVSTDDLALVSLHVPSDLLLTPVAAFILAKMTGS